MKIVKEMFEESFIYVLSFTLVRNKYDSYNYNIVHAEKWK
jgi:hypothetical protein